MKKGFTLVELLGVIAIIGIISVIAVPIVADKISDSKASALNTQITLIEKAASDYILEHNDLLDEYNLNPTLVSIEDLKNAGLLNTGKIKNPVTKDEMNGCIVVSYSLDTKGYQYKYNDETCDSLKSKYPKIVSAYETITNNETTVIKGSGLYEIDNEFVYRGNDVNNYLKINQDMYRIISINKDSKTLKIIKTTGEVKSWEENTDVTDYSFRISSINTYLNSTFYNTFDDKMKLLIKPNATWYIGAVDGNNMGFSTLKSLEQSSTYNANVGLLTLYEYVSASSNDKCQNDYLDEGCGYDNYLNFDSNYWLINNHEDKVWYINSKGNIASSNSPKTSLYKVYPVFNLAVNTIITGSGTESEPYMISLNQ